MVIKAPRRTGLGITAGPDAQVDGVDRMAVGDGVLSQGGAQGIDIEATRSQRVIDATPPAAMQWLRVTSAWAAGETTQLSGAASSQKPGATTCCVQYWAAGASAAAPGPESNAEHVRSYGSRSTAPAMIRCAVSAFCIRFPITISTVTES